MAWTEFSPGNFSRPLGQAEIPPAGIIASAQGTREPLRIHVVADFTSNQRVEDTVNAFRNGWRAMRLLKAPDIATTFVLEEGLKHYSVAAAEELQQWINQTFSVVEDGREVSTVITDMQRQQEFLPSICLVVKSAEDGNCRGHLLFLISHWRTEASGAMQFMDQLLDYVVDLLDSNSDVTRCQLIDYIQGSEVGLLTPAMEEVLMPNCSTVSTTPSEVVSRVSERYRDFRSKLPSIDLEPAAPLESSPSSLHVLQHTYDTNSTSSLI